MKYCHNCGAKLNDAENFCSECGTLVADDEQPAENHIPPAAPAAKNSSQTTLLIVLAIILAIGGLFVYASKQPNQISAKKVSDTVSSKNDIYYVGVGNNHRDKKEYSQAFENYHKALELNPRNDAAFFNKGLAYSETGDYLAAIPNYQKAVALNPENDDAFFNLGVAYSKIGDYHSAISNYLKVVELNPNDDGAYFALGNAYFEVGDFDSAIFCYQKSVNIDPNNASAYFNIGLANERLGRFDEELNALNRAIELAPNNASYRTAREEVLNYLGNVSARTALENYYNALAFSRYSDAYDMLSADLQKYYKSYSVFMEANSGIGSNAVSSVREISSSSYSAVLEYRLRTVDYKNFAGTATLQKINNRWIITDLKIREI